jgi:hypothetical protein
MVDLYLSGVDAFTVSLRANCDPATVLNAVRAAGHQVRKRGGVKGHKVAKIPIEEAARLYLGGQSIASVAEVAGLDHATMRTRLKEHGVQIRSLSEVALMRRLQQKKWGRPPKG